MQRLVEFLIICGVILTVLFVLNELSNTQASIHSLIKGLQHEVPK